MFKAFKRISLQIVKEVFQFRDAVSYQENAQIFKSHSVFSGTKSIKFIGPKI